MKITKIILTALLVAGVAGSIPAASAKKHPKSHVMSMKKGMAGGRTGMSGGGATEKSQGSSQGNVGRGTSPTINTY